MPVRTGPPVQSETPRHDHVQLPFLRALCTAKVRNLLRSRRSSTHRRPTIDHHLGCGRARAMPSRVHENSSLPAQRKKNARESAQLFAPPPVPSPPLPAFVSVHQQPAQFYPTRRAPLAGLGGCICGSTRFRLSAFRLPTFLDPAFVASRFLRAFVPACRSLPAVAGACAAGGSKSCVHENSSLPSAREKNARESAQLFCRRLSPVPCLCQRSSSLQSKIQIAAAAQSSSEVHPPGRAQATPWRNPKSKIQNRFPPVPVSLPLSGACPRHYNLRRLRLPAR
jgi:hypothetical protein